MRVGGDQQALGVDPSILEALQLVEKDSRVDHHAVADHVGDARRQDARRNQVQREVLARRQHHGVACVVAALIPHDPLHASTEKVGGLTFALVAPLSADEHDCRHGVSPAYCDPAGEPPYPSRREEPP
jgi:hypothetical protein